MKKYLAFSLGIVILLLFLRGDSISAPKLPFEFQGYVSEFKEKSENAFIQRVTDRVTIELDDLEDPTAGVCYFFTYSIKVDRKKWQSYSYMERKSLILHELGHCVLKRQHTRAKDDIWNNFLKLVGIKKDLRDLRDGCPASIMDPYMLSYYCFIKHEEYYINELFGKDNRDSYNSRMWSEDFYYGI